MILSYVTEDYTHVCCLNSYILLNMMSKKPCFSSVVEYIWPLFKSSVVNKINSYRPISIINKFAKVFELVQYGFIANSVKSR